MEVQPWTAGRLGRFRAMHELVKSYRLRALCHTVRPSDAILVDRPLLGELCLPKKVNSICVVRDSSCVTKRSTSLLILCWS